MKNKHVIKKYAIHILALPAINMDSFDLPMEQNALIVCTDRSNSFIEGDTILYKLILPFEDVEIPKSTGAFNRAHARAVLRFLEDLPESVTDLYICCSKGGSRSPALAAAILKASGRSDAPVWKNPYYVPNKLVYKRMCEETGIFMPWVKVWYKGRINTAQFKKAKRNGGTTVYERWQIIF